MEDKTEEKPIFLERKRPRELRPIVEDDFPEDDPQYRYIPGENSCGDYSRLMREINELKKQISFGSVASAEDLAERTSELEAENARLQGELEAIKEEKKPIEVEKEVVEEKKDKPNYVRDRIKKIAWTD